MTKDPIDDLVKNLSLLPGIGERTAMRLATYLATSGKGSIFQLASSLQFVGEKVRECSTCCNITCLPEQCLICQKSSRDTKVICVVACVQDLLALESSRSYFGLYHVLHGLLEPLKGIGPSKLRIKNLLTRLKDNEDAEVILATPSNVEGEATSLYIKELITEEFGSKIKVSRIVSGIPVGSELQFADLLSISCSLKMRRRVD